MARAQASWLVLPQGQPLSTETRDKHSQQTPWNKGVPAAASFLIQLWPLNVPLGNGFKAGRFHKKGSKRHLRQVANKGSRHVDHPSSRCQHPHSRPPWPGEGPGSAQRRGPMCFMESKYCVATRHGRVNPHRQATVGRAAR